MIEEKTIELFKRLAKKLAPPPKLSISEWADKFRKLSSESSSESGQWRTDRAPYQREIMNAISDIRTETVVVMSSAQVGKTELVNNAIGYYIDYDPSSIMFVMPTLELAESYSKKRLAPMIRDTPVLRDKVKDAKSRDSDNTLLEKGFPGGYIALTGANSPSSLSSRPIRILLADEIDRFPVSAGNEGDPLSLADKRTKTFWNKKKFYTSTPTERETSRIYKEFEESTKEEWCIPCPKCGKLQPLTWSQIRFEDITHECKFCKERSTEIEWKRNALKGEWIANNPNVGLKKRGFHLNALSSPWESWENIIDDFKSAKAKGEETLKVWVNTTLGEVWESKSGESADDIQLLARREQYESEVPRQCIVLTAGVDVQADRLEIEVVGWGLGKESWGIEYSVIYGDPLQNQVWNQLDMYLEKTFWFDAGEGIVISTTCIDSGYATDEVYKFCKIREHRRVFAIKGDGGIGKPFINKPTRNNRYSVALFVLGVNKGKDNILSRLNLKDEGPGYCHFPLDESKGYDEYYFKCLTNEKKVLRYKQGIAYYAWEKKTSDARNEALDIRNYANAAFEILNPNLEEMAKRNINGNIFVQAPKQSMKKRKRTLSKGF